MKKWTKYVPTILSAVSVVSIPLTAFFSAKATIKAHDILVDEDKSVKEKVKESWKYYIPAGVSGSIGMATGIGAAISNQRIQTTMLSTLGLLDAAYREKQHYISEKVQKNEILEEPDFHDPDCYEEFIDVMTGRYFVSSRDRVQERIDEFVDYLRVNRIASLDDYFSFLCLSPAFLIGDDYIWDANSMMRKYAIDDPGIFIEKSENENRYYIQMSIPPELPMLA